MTPGPLLERARMRRGISRAALAQQVGRSERWLYNIERGRSSPTLDDITALAEIVGLSLPAFFGSDEQVQRRQFLLGGVGLIGAALVSPTLGMLGPTSTAASTPNEPNAWAVSIRAALADPLGLAPVDLLPSHRSASLVAELGVLSLASQHSAFAARFPNALAAVAQTVSVSSASDQSVYLQHLSDIYSVAAWALIKADDAATAWIAADRAVSAAAAAGDSLRVAAATRCLAEVHMRAARFELASRVAMSASDSLTGQSRTSERIRGASLLTAAASEARRGQSLPAYELLAAANASANAIGNDRQELWTVFGPTNVAIHRVAVAVELGDPTRALIHAAAVGTHELRGGLLERQARFLLDVARAQQELGDGGQAVATLRSAESIAPEETRSHRVTQNVVGKLLRRARSGPRSELRMLAGRCGVG